MPHSLSSWLLFNHMLGFTVYHMKGLRRLKDRVGRKKKSKVSSGGGGEKETVRSSLTRDGLQ